MSSDSHPRCLDRRRLLRAALDHCRNPDEFFRLLDAPDPIDFRVLPFSGAPTSGGVADASRVPAEAFA